MMPLWTTATVPDVDVRVGVHVARLTVGRPPGVADRRWPLNRFGAAAARSSTRPARLWTPPSRAPDDGDAGRVVAAVLEAGQALEAARGRRRRADRPHDAAHGGLLSIGSC